jgi:hypothetical protein
MEDGSKWRIWPGDIAATLKWTPSTQLAVVEMDDAFCTHALVDEADGTRVRVIAASEDWSPENVEESLKRDEPTIKSLGHCWSGPWPRQADRPGQRGATGWARRRRIFAKKITQRELQGTGCVFARSGLDD